MKKYLLKRPQKYPKIEKSTLYKMARGSKIPAVKLELRRNNKVILWVPYSQELINKVKTIPGRKKNPLDSLLAGCET